MRIKVRVIPNASSDRVVEEDGALRVYVTTAPEKGKANRRVIELIAAHFGVRKGSVEIVKGERGREKIVDVETG